MSKTKIGGIVALALAALIALGFGIQLLNLEMFKFFAPKFEDAKREVFENTKSYTHGKAQDLGKYYEEYTKGTDEEKEIIKNVIQMNFANFDETKLDNYKLQQFLTKVRGY
jgi:hypothetical protein